MAGAHTGDAASRIQAIDRSRENMELLYAGQSSADEAQG